MPAFTSVRSVSSALGARRPRKVAIGLGGNVGDRRRTLRQAVQLLTAETQPPVLANAVLSPLYENPAMLAPGAPPEWDAPFLNMVVVGETLLSPPALLSEMKRLEHKLGRQPRGFWAPREIDLDILAYEDEVMCTTALVLPHAGLLERGFVLVPMARVWPDWRYPLPGPLHGTPLFALAERYFPHGVEDMQEVGAL